MTAVPKFPVVPGPIVGAGSRGNLIDQARTMPSMRGTVGGWMRPITVTVTRTTIVDGKACVFPTNLAGSGITQPLSNEELELKPEGDRSWKWWMLHCTDTIVLETDEEITIKSVKYKVMASKDYGEYGYLRYELIETFRPNPGVML